MIAWIFLIGTVAAKNFNPGAGETMIKPGTYSQIVLKSMLHDDKPVSYCVDIPGCCGVGEVKTTSNMMMHTCKVPTGNPDWQLDEIWDFDQPSKGMVRWRASKTMCLKASVPGLASGNSRKSSGLKLVTCDTSDILQRWVHEADGTIRLRKSNGYKSEICWVVVGVRYRKSHVNANHHMRQLSLTAQCNTFLASLKQFLLPPGALSPGEFAV